MITVYEHGSFKIIQMLYVERQSDSTFSLNQLTYTFTITIVCLSFS